MKKLLLLILIVVFSSLTVFAAETYTLKAGVAMVDKVPKSFYGTWRVASNLVSTNSGANFKKDSVDLWNLSRQGDVITLENPFSGAKASIILNEASDKVIKFKKQGVYDTKKLTDTVELHLNGDTFSGFNYLVLESKIEPDDDGSDMSGPTVKILKATYKLTGEKISGSSIIK